MAKKYWWDEYDSQNAEDNGPIAKQPQDQEEKKYWWDSYASDVGTSVANRVNAFVNNHNSFIKSYQDRFSGRKEGYDNPYVSDAADWYKTVQNQHNTYSQEADSILAYIDQNKSFLDEAWVSDVKKTLNDSKKAQADILGIAETDNKFWSQFENEDKYNEYVTQQKDYEAKSKYDTVSAREELTEMEKDLDAFSEVATAFNSAIYGGPGSKLTGAEADKAVEEYYRYVNKYFRDQIQDVNTGKLDPYDALSNMVYEKRSYLQEAERIQEANRLASVANNEDFNQYSDYVSTEYGSGFSWDKILDNQYGLGYADLTYEYINGSDNGMRDEITLAGAGFHHDTYGVNEMFSKYDNMTEDEISIYNYYYAKEGKKAAEKYLSSIEETLNYREGAKMGAAMEDKYLLELAFQASVGLDQFESGIKGVVNAVTGKDEYVAPSATQIAGGMAREDLGDVDLKYYNFKDGKWDDAKIFGNSLGQVMGDAISTTTNMLPSILTSTAINFVVPGVGSAVGTAMLGASAGGNAYQEMINLGYTKEQAGAYATLVGGSEALLQYALGGISSLSGGGEGIFQSVAGKLLPHVDNAFARTAIKLGGNMLDEGLEEGIQEILTPWFKNLTLHTDEKVNWDDVAYSTLLGALTAGFMEGGQTINGEAQTYKTGKQLQAKDISAQRLAEIGHTFAADTVAYQLADKVNENTDAYTMGRLFNEIGATITEQNVNEISRELVASGWDATVAKKNAEAFARVVEGAQMSDGMIASIEANDGLANVVKTVLIDSNTTWNQRSQGYNAMLKSLADDVANPKSAKKKQTQQIQENTPATDAVDGQSKTVTQSHAEAENVDVSPEKVTRIADVSKQTVTLEDGSEVNVKDADLSPDDGVRIETIASIDGISTEDANFVLNTLRTNKGASAQMDSLGAKEAYKYGYFGFSQEHIAKHGVFANYLTKPQMQAIYEVGKKARQKQIDNAAPTATTTERGIYFDYGDGKVVAFKDADKTLLSEKKRSAGVQAAVVLHKLGIGGDIYFFESYRNSKGQLVYKNSKGKEVAAPNGWFSESDGSIHIDLNAGAKGDGLVLFTLSHELTHFIEKWSPKKYKLLADFLIENYEKGQSMDKLVRAKQKYLSDKRGKPVSYGEAYSEVIADSMEAMLADGNVIEKIMKLKAKDSDLVAKIKQFFDNLLAKIRNIYNGLTPDSAEGKAVLEMKDSIEKIQQLFAEALVDASENFQSAPVEKNTTEDGGVDGEYDIKLSPRMEEAFKPYAKEINSVVNQSITGKGNIDGKAQMKDIMPTGPKITAMVSTSSGGAIDISKKSIALSSSDIWHEYKRHTQATAEVSRGQVAFTRRQFQNAIKCVISPDVVETVFADTNNPTQRQSFAYAKKTSRGNYVVVEAVGGKRSPRIYPVMILQFSKAKWDKMMAQGKTLGEVMYDGDAEMLKALDVQQNKKSRVSAAQFASYEAIANTLRSSQLNTKVSQHDQIVNSESAESLDVEVDADTESVAPAVLKSERAEADANYMAAVNRGDTETAQKMVDEAAKNAGFAIKAYHGTDADTFSVSDKGKVGESTGVGILGDGFYFAEKRSVAQQYGKNVYAVYLKQATPYTATNDDSYKLNASKLETDGYDSVVMTTGKGKIYMVLDPEQIKSADPVTYDDDGNVIPLSQRFNKANDDIRYSDRDYARQVDEVKNNTHDPNNHVYMGTTPTGIVNILELPKLPMLVTSQHIYSMAVSKAQAKRERRFKSRFNYHDLGWDTVKKLPEYINKPVLIIKSNTDPNDATFVVVTAETDTAGSPIVAAVKPNGKGKYFNIEFPTNIMLSGYGKDGIRGYVSTAKTENRILYASKKNSQKNKANPSVQFADILLSSDYSTNLAEFKKIVKSKFAGTIFENSGLPKYSDRGTEYQDRADEPVSNRSLLANALEGLAQSDIEKQKILEYKGKIDLVNAEEKKLQELNAQIKELSFAKGPRDTVKIRQLRDEATKTANRINIYDKQLLRLEASKPLQDVLDREKKRSYKRAEQKGKEALEAYKEKAAKEQKELAEKWQESRKKGIESRNRTAMRHKIQNFKKKLEAKLLSPTDRQYVPVDLISAMVEVCNLIDTDTNLYKADGSVNKAQVKRDETKEKLQNLKDEYEKLKTHSDPIYAGEFDEMVCAYLTTLRDEYSGKHLNDMSLDELTGMYEILVSIEETLRDARKLIGWGDADGVYEAGEAIVAEQNKITQSRKAGQRNAAQKARDASFNYTLSPVRNVERMSGYNQDSALLKLFKKFEQGVRKKNFFAMNAYKIFEQLASGKEYDDAIYKEVGGKKYTDVKGRNFGVSKMQMMQAILSWEREMANKNLHHIEKGGFTFADLDKLRKGKLKDAVSAEYSHRVPAATGMVAEFRKVLQNDKWCQDYMAAARKFFNEMAKDAINETSVALKHRIIAKDKSYIPFEVDTNFVNTEITDVGAVQKTINAYGSLQDTKDNAPQALYITGLNNILDRHIDQVGNIYGLAVEVRNFNKVWNVVAKDASGSDVAVKDSFDTNWGTEGAKHIRQAVMDIQGPRIKERNALYDKVKSGYIGATFLLNLSVVTKQIGSLFSSTSMLRWRGPGKMVGNLIYTMANHKKISAEVDKYTATAWMRRQGMSDAELYTLMTQAKKPGLFRLTSKLPVAFNPTKWITAMDHAVALSLWRYAKQDTAKRTGLKGEELLKATAEFYDEVIENTQSMTDVLHRPEVQKRGDIISESLGLFKTDLYQMAGQLQTTCGRFIANKSKDNGKALGRTLYAVAASALWGQLMTTVFALLRYKVKQYRDDEDEELTVESWLKRQGFAFGGDLVGYIFPLLGSEVVGIIENIMYGESDEIVDSLELTAINDLYETMVTVGSSIKEGEMPKPSDMKKFTVKALQVFGVPANNILRTIESIHLHAKDIANGEFLSFEAGVDRSPKHHIHMVTEAVDKGNLSVAKGLYEEALEDLATEKADGGEFGDDEVKEAKSELKSALGTKYKNGEVTEEITRKILSEIFGLDDDDIYWTFDKWDYAIENGSSDDYAKYEAFYTSVQTGKDLKAVIKEYTDHGVDKKTLASQITSYFKPLYKEMSNTERAGVKGYLLNAYQLLGYNRNEKSKDIDKWLKD